MAEDPTLAPYWAQFYATWEEFDAAVRWLFPDGVEIAGFSVSADRLAGLGRFSVGSNLSVALAAAIKQGLGKDRAQAVRDFFGVVSPLEYEASKDRRGGGGRFGEAFVDALAAPVNTPGALMAQIIVPNVYRLSARATVGTQDVVNVLHFLGAGPGLEEDLVDDFKTNFFGISLPAGLIGNTSVIWRDVTAVDLSSIDGGIYLDSTPFAVTTSAQLATAGAAALVQWNGGTRNRNARGRTYYGPLRESHIDTDGRTLAAATKTAFEAAWETFRAAMVTAGWTLGVLSRQTSTFYPVTRMTIAPIIATQRRRIRS